MGRLSSCRSRSGLTDRKESQHQFQIGKVFKKIVEFELVSDPTETKPNPNLESKGVTAGCPWTPSGTEPGMGHRGTPFRRHRAQPRGSACTGERERDGARVLPPLAGHGPQPLLLLLRGGEWCGEEEERQERGGEVAMRARAPCSPARLAQMPRPRGAPPYVPERLAPASCGCWWKE
jgi:hypothetical protein